MQKSAKKSLLNRIRLFVLEVWTFCDELPHTPSGKNCSHQLSRSASSIGANFRSAFRGRSSKEFRAKLGISIEEADECCYWLDLAMAYPRWAHLKSKAKELHQEANELTAILVSIRTKHKC